MVVLSQKRASKTIAHNVSQNHAVPLAAYNKPIFFAASGIVRALLILPIIRIYSSLYN